MSTHLVTSNGSPSFSVPAIVEADLENGAPLHYGGMATLGEDEVSWRVARVQTYVAPPHPLGFASGGAKPFHQDYRHYKYYGFAGRGAKTSWAYNPKHNE